MNRKRKKQVVTLAVLLFFLAAGVWYYFHGSKIVKQSKTDTEMTGVLDILETEATVTESPKQEKSVPKELVVYVCGAVESPGIYSLPENSRLYEAIRMAGGFSKEADPAYHNLARSIEDGERIYILSSSETKALTTEQQVAGEEGTASISQANGLINLNTATAEAQGVFTNTAYLRNSTVIFTKTAIFTREARQTASLTVTAKWFTPTAIYTRAIG